MTKNIGTPEPEFLVIIFSRCSCVYPAVTNEKFSDITFNQHICNLESALWGFSRIISGISLHTEPGLDRPQTCLC